MKKVHLFILKSYIGPLLMTFFISMFILVMQFLWRYVDDLVGKGLEWHVLAELLFYASLQVVPMALPLAILLASLMTLQEKIKTERVDMRPDSKEISA